MAIFPRQKLTTAQKNKVDKITGKSPVIDTLDYYIEETLNTNERDEILSQYRLLEGDIIEKDYEYVLNPFNTTVDRYKRFGSVLRNFDIISPVVKLYAGEFSQRFKHIQVFDSNPTDDNRYKEGLNLLVGNYYNQKAINEMNALGLMTNRDSEEQQPLETQVETYNRGFDDNRVISGQEILDYIHFDQDMDDKMQDAYMDWLVAGRVISYKGVFHNDIDYEIVPTWEVTFPKNSKSNFIEDGDWVVRRQIMTANQILDRWHDKLSSADVDWLEEEAKKELGGGTTGYTRLSTQWITNKEEYKQYSLVKDVEGIEVFHVQHHSFRKVGILTYISEAQQEEVMEVDDTYTLNPMNGDISIEWSWLSEVREGWRIGDATKGIYLDVRPLPYNRMELNNSSAQKLSYNGRVEKSVTGKVLSIVSAGKPYQLIYNILHYQFEKIINKNKDKIAVIPQGIIPKGVGGWDEEKFMYYAHANSMMVVDETSPTAGLAMQGIKVLDMSLGTFARECIDLMQAVKSEWWEAIGMNRQRYGDSKASDGKAVTEQAIFRSAIISDELNRKFEKFQEKDYAGLLDISKVAFIDGKKGKYINSDGREAFLKMNPDDAIHHLESDYNIHVKNSRRESEKIQTAKEFGFSLGQNGSASQMLELIDSTNFAKTKEVIKKMEAAKAALEQQSQQSAQDSAQAIEQMKAETAQADRDMEKYKVDREYDKAIDVKTMEIENSTELPDKEDNGEVIRMNNHKIDVDNKKLSQEDKNLINKTKETNARVTALKQQKVGK